MKKEKADSASLRKAAEEMDRAVGGRIRAARRASGLTQGQLAARLGLSYQQVQKYETASNRISAGRLWAVARILGANVSDFFKNGGEGFVSNEGRSSRRSSLKPRPLDPEVETALARLAQALARRPR